MVCWEYDKKSQGGIEGQCIDVFILKINGMLGIR